MTSKDAPKPGQKPGKNKTQARSAARLYAVQALFQMEQSDQSTNKVIVEFEDHRFGATYEGDEYAEGDTKLFRKLVNDRIPTEPPEWTRRLTHKLTAYVQASWYA